jgi:hypothetical protein
MYRVNLPIPDPATLLNHRRPLFYRLFASQPPSTVILSIPFSPLFPGSTQMPPQGPATPFIRPNPTVNRLVTHDGLSLKRSPSHNLFGTKPLANQRLNRPKLRRPISPVPTGTSLSPARFLNRMAGAIAAIMHGLAVASMWVRYRRRVLSRIVLGHAARHHTPADHLGGYFRPSCREAARAAAAVRKLADSFEHVVSVEVL